MKKPDLKTRSLRVLWSMGPWLIVIFFILIIFNMGVLVKGKQKDLELARNLKLSLDTLRSALSELHFSSMVPFPEHGDGESSDDRPDFLGEQPEPSDILHKRETYELVTRELTAVERRLVDGYYFKGLTLKDIGKKEGISESRVCQIHGRMLDRLAERLENQA